LDGTLTPATAVLDEAVPSPQAPRENAMTTNADNNLSFIFTPLLSRLNLQAVDFCKPYHIVPISFEMFTVIFHLLTT
jgi:hypothetical protein